MVHGKVAVISSLRHPRKNVGQIVLYHEYCDTPAVLVIVLVQLHTREYLVRNTAYRIYSISTRAFARTHGNTDT